MIRTIFLLYFIIFEDFLYLRNTVGCLILYIMCMFVRVGVRVCVFLILLQE